MLSIRVRCACRPGPHVKGCAGSHRLTDLARVLQENGPDKAGKVRAAETAAASAPTATASATTGNSGKAKAGTAAQGTVGAVAAVPSADAPTAPPVVDGAGKLSKKQRAASKVPCAVRMKSQLSNYIFFVFLSCKRASRQLMFYGGGLCYRNIWACMRAPLYPGFPSSCPKSETRSVGSLSVGCMLPVACLGKRNIVTVDDGQAAGDANAAVSAAAGSAAQPDAGASAKAEDADRFAREQFLYGLSLFQSSQAASAPTEPAQVAAKVQHEGAGSGAGVAAAKGKKGKALDAAGNTSSAAVAGAGSVSLKGGAAVGGKKDNVSGSQKSNAAAAAAAKTGSTPKSEEAGAEKEKALSGKGKGNNGKEASKLVEEGGANVPKGKPEGKLLGTSEPAVVRPKTKKGKAGLDAVQGGDKPGAAAADAGGVGAGKAGGGKDGGKAGSKEAKAGKALDRGEDKGEGEGKKSKGQKKTKPVPPPGPPAKGGAGVDGRVQQKQAEGARRQGVGGLVSVSIQVTQSGNG